MVKNTKVALAQPNTLIRPYSYMVFLYAERQQSEDIKLHRDTG